LRGARVEAKIRQHPQPLLPDDRRVQIGGVAGLPLRVLLERDAIASSNVMD
jgi:hypothetical protein